MRVLLDTSPLLNASETRGIGTYTRELLRALHNLSGLPEPLVVQATHEVGEILEPDKNFDLIHYPFFDLFFATLPKKSPLPTVVTVHDVIPLLYPEHYPVGVKGRWRFWQQKRRLRQVEAVLTDSEASKRDIRQHLGIREARLFVVPLAANPDLTEPTEYLQAKVKQELSLPNKYVLYIGDINYNKNLPTLLLALTQVDPSIHLCVVSQTFNNAEIPEGKVIADVIARNNLEERIHVLSIPKDHPEILAAVIAGARCLVQPSLYEGFGLPVVEALRVGTVVVCANTGSLPEVAGEATIMVDPTIAGLSDGITRAVGLRGEERQEWIRRGKKQAREFSWEKTAEQTYAVYQAARRFFAGEEK